MANLFQITPKTFGSKLGDMSRAEASGQVRPDNSDIREGETLGAPSDSVAALRKAGHRRTNKAHSFLSHRCTPDTLLVWMVISNIIMPIHYRLFKYSTSLFPLE